MNATRIYWSPKVRRELIYRLYKSNESGVFDEELIDDVGFRLYERCESILMVTNRQVYCPICHTKFQLKTTWKDKRTHFPCPADGCPWEVEWEQYHQSFTKKNLIAGGAMDTFERFYRDFPHQKTTQTKMITIDILIHAFHMDLKNNLPRKSAGFNLIEGSLKQIVEFLNSISSTTAVDKNRWRTEEKLSRDYRSGKRIP